MLTPLWTGQVATKTVSSWEFEVLSLEMKARESQRSLGGKARRVIKKTERSVKTHALKLNLSLTGTSISAFVLEPDPPRLLLGRPHQFADRLENSAYLSVM